MYSYKFICIYIVSFYSNVTKIGTHSYHYRFNQSEPNKEARVANGYLSRVPNTIITDDVIMIKIT